MKNTYEQKFLEKAKKIHGSKFDYSKVTYTKAKEKVVIVCNTCGNEFTMTPDNHTHKTKPQGCPVCAKKVNNKRIGEVGKARKGTSTAKPLDPSDYSAPIVEDLGMRQLKNRKMRYVRLACVDCGKHFDISCDNAKRRKECRCQDCKHKVVIKCQGCGDSNKYYPGELKTRPRRNRICGKCQEIEDGIVTTVKREGMTLENIHKYLYIENGVIHKKLCKTPIDIEQSRPRIYTAREYYVQIAYALLYGKLDNTVGLVDESKGYVHGNFGTGLSYGGFRTDKPGILYYLRINGGQAYKIGITNKSVNERFRASDIQKIEVLKEVYYEDGKECADEERRILNEYKKYKYEGTSLLESGNTELFSIDVLGEDNE